MRILVEEDAILRVVPVILDPATADEHCRAIADFFIHDEPDFAGWLDGVRRAVPGLYPAEVKMVRDEAALAAGLAEADAVVVESLGIGAAELARAPRLKHVQRFGMLPGNVDADACARRGVTVGFQRRRVNIAVAEQAFTLMLALAKRVPELNGVVTEAALRQAGFDPRPFDRRYTGNSNFARITGLRTLAEATVGIVGMGEIGREIASRAHAFGMRILYYQRNRIAASEETALGARHVPLRELMAGADYICPALPLNASTRGIIGRAELAAAKPGAFLIDVARAELVDRAALVEALAGGRLGGFALDVGYEEPARPDEPLLKFGRNVILMPHTAVAERQNGLKDMAEMCGKIWRGVTRPASPL